MATHSSINFFTSATNTIIWTLSNFRYQDPREKERKRKEEDTLISMFGLRGKERVHGVVVETIELGELRVHNEYLCAQYATESE